MLEKYSNELGNRKTNVDDLSSNELNKLLSTFANKLESLQMKGRDAFVRGDSDSSKDRRISNSIVVNSINTNTNYNGDVQYNDILKKIKDESFENEDEIIEKLNEIQETLTKKSRNETKWKKSSKNIKWFVDQGLKVTSIVLPFIFNKLL